MGIGMGLFVYKLAIDRDTRLAFFSINIARHFYFEPPFVKYSGTIIAQDESNNSIVLKVPSSFSVNSTDSFSVSVPYDSETDWMSIEYSFRGGIMEARHWSPEDPRTLPRDTLVSVVQYYNGTEWQTIAIAYLRRTNI